MFITFKNNPDVLKRRLFCTADIIGTMSSGKADTGFSNTLRQISYMEFIAHRAGLTQKEYDILVAGDDVLISGSRVNILRFQAAG